MTRKLFFDSVTNTPIRTPDDKVLLLHARAMREYLENCHADRLYWFDTEDVLPDGMTKGSIDREPIIKVCEQGIWSIRHASPISQTFATNDVPTEA